jgi:hypothetical protein
MSGVLPFSGLWYGGQNAVSNAIEMHEYAGNFKEA